MSALIPVAVVTILVVLNGIFVAAEFAIVGAPRATLERRAAEGNAAARAVTRVLRDPRNQDRYIATAQIGITLATLGLGMYGEHQLAHWIGEQLEHWDAFPKWLAAHTVASILAISVFTYVHIVFGEMVPKSLALSHAEGSALRITPVMLAIRLLLYPFVIGLNAMGNVLLRFVGVDRSKGSTDRYYSAEELEFVVEESLQAGLISRGSGRVLRELFDLGALTAEDVMAPRVQVRGFAQDASVEEMARVVREHLHTRYPVYRDSLDDIVGVVHIRDVSGLILANRPLHPGVVTPVPYVPGTTPLDTVVKRMSDQSVQFAVVLDEHGGTAGIITPDDVSSEIVGRVEESDGPGEMFRDAAGRQHVAGTVRLDELGERFNRHVDYEDVETLSGLVLALLERPPRIGDVVEYDGLRIQVTRVDGRGVADSVVTPLAVPED